VAVPVGLHHGAHPARGDRAGEDADVVGDGAQVDVGPGGADRGVQARRS
jgi:hypothetical protein